MYILSIFLQSALNAPISASRLRASKESPNCTIVQNPQKNVENR